MNQNTNNVDVLAVLERASRRYAAGSQAGQQMRYVRAAVAELIDAASRALPELASKEYARTDDMGAHEALRAALTRVGGVK